MAMHSTSSETLRRVKARFGIVGVAPKLDYALTAALQVAETDMSVLITGDSGTGKESFSKVIHALSHRRHHPFVLVNCGAIPAGTVDSELFGHEKGAFTGAIDARKGYFEYADKGTIFLDEVSELPLSTQARLLRVLEYGEFMKVGSSKMKRTDVRIVAATNVDLQERFEEGKFREDLYYRLSTVPITVPPLRERQEDIPLLFRKFAMDCAEKYKTAQIYLTEKAEKRLVHHHFPGNIRQLKNIVEQLTVLSLSREVDEEVLGKHLPGANRNTFMVVEKESFSKLSDREILYQILLEMRRDVNQLKSLTHKLLEGGEQSALLREHGRLFGRKDTDSGAFLPATLADGEKGSTRTAGRYEEVAIDAPAGYEVKEVVSESGEFSVKDWEKEAIIRALGKYKKRRVVAEKLGISERTLYRKIRRYAISS